MLQDLFAVISKHHPYTWTLRIILIGAILFTVSAVRSWR